MKLRREFPAKVKLAAFQRCGGNCEACSAKLFPGNCEYDHDTPDGLGGNNDLDNIRVLCRACHRQKSSADATHIAKAKRRERNDIAPKVSRNPMPCGKRSRQSKKISGEVVARQTQAEKHRATMAALGRAII